MRQTTAAIIMLQDRVLLARRKPEGQLAGKWEFPGGKAEPGEELESALQRELKEELGINCRIHELIGSVWFENKNQKFQLNAFWTEIVSGTVTPLEHAAFAWAAPSEISAYDLADSDRKLLPAVLDKIRYAEDE